MKKITAVLGTLIIVLAANTVSARSLHPLTYVLKANIESMNIDQESYLNDMRIYGGKILVKQLKREITLQLEFAPECPAGMVCPMVLCVHEITLPLKTQFTDRCGTTIYVAERNMMPVDGAHEIIKVADNTTNMCPTFVALPETSAIYSSTIYDRINGGTVSTHSTFEADKLEGRVLPTNDLPKVLPAIQ